jgi:hypothetical protein
MPPAPDSRDRSLARQKLTMKLVCGALVIGAILLVVLPVKLPLPLRLGLAFCDLVAAAAVWLTGRQYFSGR